MWLFATTRHVSVHSRSDAARPIPRPIPRYGRRRVGSRPRTARLSPQYAIARVRTFIPDRPGPMPPTPASPTPGADFGRANSTQRAQSPEALIRARPGLDARHARVALTFLSQVTAARSRPPCRESRPWAGNGDLTGTTGSFWMMILIFQNGPVFHPATPLGAALSLDTAPALAMVICTLVCKVSRTLRLPCASALCREGWYSALYRYPAGIFTVI